MNARIQILKEYASRTEYKVLRDWLPVIKRPVGGLDKGTCVLPGIVLAKMPQVERSGLLDWCREWGNQLILTPPWWRTDLGQTFGLNFQILLEEKDAKFKGITLSYILVSKLKAKWQIEKKEAVALEFKFDSGSGLITITTVPLLDYRLLHWGSALKDLFLQLVNVPETVEGLVRNQKCLSNFHLYTLLLAAGGIEVMVELAGKIQRYIGAPTKGLNQDEVITFLVDKGFLEPSGSITDDGLSLLQEKGYRAYIREICKRGDDDGW